MSPSEASGCFSGGSPFLKAQQLPTVLSSIPKAAVLSDTSNIVQHYIVVSRQAYMHMHTYIHTLYT